MAVQGMRLAVLRLLILLCAVVIGAEAHWSVPPGHQTGIGHVTASVGKRIEGF